MARLSLKEWNEALEYAEKLCENSGINIKPKPYEMYDNRKGIYIQLFDKRGRPFEQWATGIHDNLDSMKQSLKMQVRNAIKAYY